MKNILTEITGFYGVLQNEQWNYAAVQFGYLQNNTAIA